MALETVRFFLTDQNTDPILGVTVRVFDSAGAVFQTQDVTVDVAGDAVAEVTLDGDDPPNEYTIRMSKTGVAFDGSLGDVSKSPQKIEVWSPPANSPTGTNDFDIQGETFTRPTAVDARLCRCSGFFKDAAGRALVGLDIKIINQFKPAVVDGDAVLGERIDLRTDDDGYLEVDLYRGAEYLAWVQSIQAAEDDPTGAIVFPREVFVPDQSSANLIDLLFAIVDSIAYTPTSLSMSVGDQEDVTTVVTATDGRTLTGTACDDVIYDTDDPSVAVVGVYQDKLVVTAIGPGTTQLTATRRDQSVVQIPEPTALPSLTITVS